MWLLLFSNTFFEYLSVIDGPEISRLLYHVGKTLYLLGREEGGDSHLQQLEDLTQETGDRQIRNYKDTLRGFKYKSSARHRYKMRSLDISESVLPKLDYDYEMKIKILNRIIELKRMIECSSLSTQMEKINLLENLKTAIKLKSET